MNINQQHYSHASCTKKVTRYNLQQCVQHSNDSTIANSTDKCVQTTLQYNTKHGDDVATLVTHCSTLIDQMQSSPHTVLSCYY